MPRAIRYKEIESKNFEITTSNFTNDFDCIELDISKIQKDKNYNPDWIVKVHVPETSIGRMQRPEIYFGTIGNFIIPSKEKRKIRKNKKIHTCVLTLQEKTDEGYEIKFKGQPTISRPSPNKRGKKKKIVEEFPDNFVIEAYSPDGGGPNPKNVLYTVEYDNPEESKILINRRYKDTDEDKIRDLISYYFGNIYRDFMIFNIYLNTEHPDRERWFNWSLNNNPPDDNEDDIDSFLKQIDENGDPIEVSECKIEYLKIQSYIDRGMDLIQESSNITKLEQKLNS